MDDVMAACRLRDVRCHVCGTSIQPGGLSTAMTVRSSCRMRIGLQSGSSMELGLAIRPMVAAGVNRLKLFGYRFYRGYNIKVIGDKRGLTARRFFCTMTAWQAASDNCSASRRGANLTAAAWASSWTAARLA